MRVYFEMTDNLLYSKCRICSIDTDDIDGVDLFENNDGMFTILSIPGKLYQEFMGFKLITSEPSYYPKNICTSCDIQMKLFKELKKRALKSLQKIVESHRNKETSDKAQQKQQQQEMLTFATGVTERSKSNQDLNLHIGNLSNIFIENCDGTEESLVQVDSDYIEDQEQTHKAEDVNFMLIYDAFGSAPEANESFHISNIKEKYDENIATETPVTELNNSEKYTAEYITYKVHYIEQKIDTGEVNNLKETSENQKDNSTTVKINTNLYKCKECVCEFRTLRLLRVHRQENHPLVHRCTECPKALRSVEALEVHKKQHLGLPAYSCEQCNKTFKQKVHYQYHIKRHNNERNFSCKECGKKYVSKSDLTIHMRQHIGVRPYTCPIENCGKKCYTEQHLKMHMYHHNRTKSFECDICHGKFVSPTVLHTHLKTMHAERRFECTFCGKKFRRKHHLKVHVLTHGKDPLMSNSVVLLESLDNSFNYGDVMMDVTDQNQTTSDLSYKQFIEVNGFSQSRTETGSDDEFFKDAIESCAESSEGDNDFNLYNAFSTL